MAGRYNLDRPLHPWKHYKESYKTRSSVQTILHLHKIEKQLRDEIRHEQVKVFSRQEILTLYPDGRA